MAKKSSGQPALEQASAVPEQLGAILERVSDAIVGLDRGWRYTYVNRKAASLFGRKPKDLIGKHIWTEFPEGVGQPFHRAYEKLSRSRFLSRWRIAINLGIAGSRTAFILRRMVCRSSFTRSLSANGLRRLQKRVLNC